LAGAVGEVFVEELPAVAGFGGALADDGVCLALSTAPSVPIRVRIS
jgi:hypothetical protein